MKTPVVYESLFGNTHAVAEAIAGELEQFGPSAAVNVAAVGNGLEDADLLVVGAPTHAWAPPAPPELGTASHRDRPTRPVREWLAELPDGKGRPAAAFDRVHLDVQGVAIENASGGHSRPPRQDAVEGGLRGEAPPRARRRPAARGPWSAAVSTRPRRAIATAINHRLCGAPQPRSGSTTQFADSPQGDRGTNREAGSARERRYRPVTDIFERVARARRDLGLHVGDFRPARCADRSLCPDTGWHTDRLVPRPGELLYFSATTGNGPA